MTDFETIERLFLQAELSGELIITNNLISFRDINDHVFCIGFDEKGNIQKIF